MAVTGRWSYSFANFAVDKAKQFVATNPDGYVIGDAILFYLDEDLLSLVGRPSVHNWVQFHAETGDYDVTCERDERAAVNPDNRRLYRYQVQGPTALEVLTKANGGPLPEIKFFNMGRITIGGHEVRALHHGMSGVPGLELFGPWSEGAEVKAAIVEAGQEFGLKQVGSRVYATNTLESGWIPCPLPAVFSGDDMKAYREWLPADWYEGTGSLGGSLYSDDISDYYMTPYDLGYGGFVKFDHDFIGRAALEEIAKSPKRQKVTLAWHGEDVARAMETMFHRGERAKYIDLPLSNYSTWPNDRLMRDGKLVGVSTFSGYSSNESSMLSLGSSTSSMRAGHGGRARVGRGGRRLEEAGRRAPRADRDPGDRLARALLGGRPRVVPAEVSAEVELVGSTGRSRGRSRCTSGASGASSPGPTAAPRPRRSASAGSGSGTPICSTCSRRRAWPR